MSSKEIERALHNESGMATLRDYHDNVKIAKIKVESVVHMMEAGMYQSSYETQMIDKLKEALALLKDPS